eukprot:g8064.t1
MALLFVIAVLLAHVSTAITTTSTNLPRVYLVPHSHDDVGWVDDMDTMYNSTRPGNNTIKNIYDTVTEALTANPSRRFISVEMYWLHRWWNDIKTSEEQRLSFKKLVINKQVEFVCGGWVMHDEAVSHYQADIDQMTIGHEFIIETFGKNYVPRTCWHIDPFGSVGSNAALYGKMSFNAFGTNRIPDNVKTLWENNRELDFIWEGTNSGIESDKLFTHVMDSYGYCPPNIPRNAFMWDDYNYWSKTGDGKGPEPQVNESNVLEFAQNITHWFKKQGKWRRVQEIMLWPYGCDLEQHNATLNMKQMDYIINYINKNPNKFGLTVQYATLTEYFDALNAIKTVEWPERGIGTNLSFLPLGTVSQYPGFYNESTEMSWWSGFFTSRPILKRKARVASSFLVTAERLYIQSLFFNLGNSSRIIVPGNNLPDGIMNLRRAVAVVQHHDAIPGTCRPEVIEVYLNDINVAMNETKGIIKNSIRTILQLPGRITANVGKKVFLSKQDGEKNTNFDVFIYNPLAWARNYIVEILTIPSVGAKTLSNMSKLKNIIVRNVNGTVMPSQYNDKNGAIYFYANTLHPLGITNFNIQPIYDDSDSNSYKNKQQYMKGDRSELMKDNNDNIVLKNDFTEWVFDTDGNLLRVNQKLVSLEFVQYPTDTTTHLSGDAYHWRPMGEAKNIILCKTPSAINYDIEGKVTSVLNIIYANECVNGTELKVTFKLNKIGGKKEQMSMDINVEVGPTVHTNSDVAMRIQSSILNPNGHFYTDEGGFHHRLRIFDPDKDKDVLNNIAGNYFPVVSSAYIQDKNANDQLTIFTEHSHGITSSKSGEMEIMLHRKISSGFINLKNVNKSYSSLKILFSTVSEYENVRNYMTQYIEHPPMIFFHHNESNRHYYQNKTSQHYSQLQKINAMPLSKEYVPIPSALQLPINIHLMTLEVGMHEEDEGRRVVRFRLINLLQPNNNTSKRSTTVNVTSLLKNILTIKKWQVRTLTGAMEVAYAEKTRMTWGATANSRSSRITMSNNNNNEQQWLTGDVVVSIKPLDIVTLHLICF